MSAAAAGMIVGSGIQAYAQYEQAQAQADAAKVGAAFKRQQAAEILKRAELNSKQTMLEGQAFKGQQVASFAASGVSVTSQSTLQTLEDTNMKILDEIDNIKREAKFKADQLLISAKYEEKAAKGMKKAGMLGSAATLLVGGAAVYGSKR